MARTTAPTRLDSSRRRVALKIAASFKGEIGRTEMTKRSIRTAVPGKKTLKTLTLGLFCMLAAGSTSAQVQKTDTEITSRLSAPARITRVTNRGIVGDDATLVIRVEWSLETLRPVTPLGFIGSVEVEYADGSKNTGSTSVGASARQADIRVLNKGSNAPRKFKAKVETTFSFFDPNFATRTAEFDLSKSAPSSPPDTRPGGDALTISRVRALSGGCGGKDCFTVEWAVGQQRGFTFEQFNVQGEFSYVGAVTTNRNASATASASARSVQLQVDNPKTGSLKIVARVTIKASANVQQRQTAELTGSF